MSSGQVVNFIATVVGGSDKAQEHLRAKYNYLSAKNRVNSAEEFIDKVAATSSLSGQPYMVRCADGVVVRTDQWLRDALARRRAGVNPAAAPRT